MIVADGPNGIVHCHSFTKKTHVSIDTERPSVGGVFWLILDDSERAGVTVDLAIPPNVFVETIEAMLKVARDAGYIVPGA